MEATIVVPKKPIVVHEVTQTTVLDAHVTQIHKMRKNMMTNSDTPVVNPVKVVTNINVVSCVYRGGAHLFEECSGNPIFVNYVDNNNYNNP